MPKRIDQLAKGTWSISTAYTLGDIVDYLGSSYICIVNNTGDNPTTSSWALLAQKGDNIELQKSATHIQWRVVGGTWADLVLLSDLVGPTGPQGNIGNIGPQGNQGTAGKEVQIQVSGGYIQWKYDSDVSWTNLILVSTLKGDTGDSSYTYIAYASDDTGTGFTLTFDAALNYIAIKHTTVAIASPIVSDFTGLWKNYKGLTGSTGPAGSGSGDVLGPATNTADYLPQWNGENTKTLKNGVAIPAGGLAGLTALADKVNKVTGKGLSTEDYTSAEKTKLSGIATGANVGVVPNTSITGATKTKITYDIKGLVTSGANATCDDITDGTNTHLVTTAEKTVIGNTSNTNSGDNAANSNIPTAGTTPSTQAFGDTAAGGAATTWSKNDHKHAMPAAPTTITGNAGTATKLAATKNINGVAFDGSADITIPSNIAPGTLGNLLTSNGTIWTSAAPPISVSVTIKGDLQTFSTVPTRLPIGNDGYLLEARASETTGLRWIAPPTTDSMTVTAAPALDHLASGIKIALTATANMAFGDVGYIASTGKVTLIDADAIASMSAVVMCADATINADASGNFLLQGIARNDTWAWTVGGLIYGTVTGTSGNTLSQTAPTGTDDVVQIIGVATHSDRMYFNPQLVQVELTG